MADFDDAINGNFREELDEDFDQKVIKNESELKKESEKAYLKRISKSNKNLIQLTILERERIARHIKKLYEQVQGKHKELSDNIDEWDAVFRMERKSTNNDDGDLPNYRTPLSTATLEVVHANIMNVFFTPADVMRVLPTEKNDIPKVSKLETFGNWSVKNELDIFEQADRIFHSSAKNGECPYIMSWVKEYGVDIEREVLKNPLDPRVPLIDSDTGEPVIQEREVNKLLYNGPKLEVFSRKDYIQPLNTTMDKTPDWEMRRLRMTYDRYLREELKGKMYSGSIKEILDWSPGTDSGTMLDYSGDFVPMGQWEKEFIEFYGRLRIRVIKEAKSENEEAEIQELEDEFIAIVNIKDEVLCSLKKNKFPMKMRPIGVDYFVPDDEGRRAGIGIMEFMSSLQKAYDNLFNQYVFGTVQSNNPIVFFEPLGNQRDEPQKIRAGYMYPTANAATYKPFQFPQPNQSMQNMLDLIRFWSQMLFGISDFSAGLESSIDPDAPAKKAQIVVAQGNVRLNMVIKRKNKTLKDILKRWFLLYQANMPQNKFMRITGEKGEYDFEGINMTDFALKDIPDFELIGNVLNSNKSLEAQKALSIYSVLARNPLFSPQTQQGLRMLNQITRWLIDKFDETGLSNLLPSVEGETVQTPEEENARFLQGDMGEPGDNEDDVNHIQVHSQMLIDPTVPEKVKDNVREHIRLTVEKIRQKITYQTVLSQIQGGVNDRTSQTPVAVGQAQGVPGAVAGLEGFEGGTLGV